MAHTFPPQMDQRLLPVDLHSPSFHPTIDPVIHRLQRRSSIGDHLVPIGADLRSIGSGSNAHADCSFDSSPHALSSSTTIVSGRLSRRYPCADESSQTQNDSIIFPQPMRRISSAHPLLQASVHLARSEQSAIAARHPARAVHQYVNIRLTSLSVTLHV